ncbi:zinc finger protein 595-like isoform X2 [Periplaneta americana]|uniref:zinc finger protein 595-like isoform X2 n=1 Tax=Periplaneta americana TaxID=6978 RepID=UPI0037E99C64
MELEDVRNFHDDSDNEIIIKVETENGDRTDNSEQSEEEECSGQLCRLCANNIKTGIYIFNGIGREQHLADKINTCLPITVKVTDLLPKQLCVPCNDKLNICFEFAEACVNAEKKLNKLMKVQTVEFPGSTLQSSVYSHSNQDNVAEKQVDKFKDVTDTNKLCCPLCCEGNMVLQKGVCNAEEINFFNGSQFSPINEIVEIFGTAGDYTSKQFENVKSVTHTSLNGNNHNLFEEAASRENKCKNEENVDAPCITFMCRFCGEFCPDLVSSITHSKCHSNENGFPCVLCNASFTTEIDVENHFKNHNFEVHKKLEKSRNKNLEQKSMPFKTDEAKLCKCSECGKIFGTEERLSFHTQFHFGARPLVCERCTKEFTSENMLFRHMNLVHGGTETCKQCGASFMSKMKLDMHTCELARQPFRCKICKQQFQDTTSLRSHTASHNLILAKPFQCNHCDASFTRVSKLNTHVEMSHCRPLIPQVCVRCNICRAVFPNMEYAMLHADKHNTSVLLDEIKNLEDIEATMLFCCEYCEMLFTQMDTLLQHSLEHSGDNPYCCVYCNMLFPDHSQMKYHKKYHLENEDQYDELSLFTIPLLFVCEKCVKSFNTWKGLQIHYNILHGGYQRGNMQNLDKKKSKETDIEFHLCEDCGESFKKRADLRRHRLKEHRPQNRFPCEECGKVLLHYSGLIIHRRQHTGERPFMCDVCGKSFPQGPAMYTHRRTHTRDYPYRCEICGQTFNNKGDLNNHRRSKHTKERPFKCNVCSKSFLTSGVYYQHKQLHAGIRKYKCSHCDRSFSRWNALSIHTKSHTGEKPHACHVCGRGFAQKGDMKKHMRTQHGVLK